MDIKKYKTPFLIMIAILAFLEIMFLLKLLFADSKGFEWGNVSDWISAVGSIGTFLLAYIALKNAPSWFNQKSNETGFNHVLSLMSEYDELEHDIQRLYSDVLSARVNDDNFEEIRDKIRNNIYKIKSLEGKLLSCKRWKIEPLPRVSVAFNRLRKFCNFSSKMLASQQLRDFARLSEFQEKLSDVKTLISEDALFFKVNIEDIFNFQKQ